jgi:hypothetical protein
MLEYRNSIITQVSGQIQEEISAVTTTVAQLLSRVECLNRESFDMRCEILKEICNRSNLQDSPMQNITAGIEMLSVTDAAEQQLRNSVQNAILQRLRYTEMSYRVEDIDEAHAKTFEWAFRAPEREQSWSNLSDWLKTGSNIYWVCGKAGSGKSTFMKHLVDDQQKRIETYLRVWAGGSSLCIATFFFWNSGTRLQKSQLGFLRALLCQVLNQYPALIPAVLPRYWADSYSRSVNGGSNESQNPSIAPCLVWKHNELKDALRVLSKQTTIPLKLCFVVDGLDEFNGDHEEMAELFKEIGNSTNAKVLLSSRPWQVFEDLFGSCRKLKLQELTYRDIQLFVHDKFYHNASFLKLIQREPTEAIALLREVVEKADGVFLWVKLVVQSLLDGIRNRDELADLWTRLRLLPRELRPLYERLLELIDPVVYLPWASRAVQILRCNGTLCNVLQKASEEDHFAERLSPKPITISEFSLAMNETHDILSIQNLTPREFQLYCEDTKVRLISRCAGFLEVSNTHGASIVGLTSLVQYFHRTAKDFLESEEIWTKLLSQTAQTEFNPNVAMMRSCLYGIKLRIAFSPNTLQSFLGSGAPRYVARFMAYAIVADSHTKSRDYQTSLIDELSNLTAGRTAREWLRDLRPYSRLPGGFLEVSALWGLPGYVRDTFEKKDEMERATISTSLLQLILSEDVFPSEKLPSPIPEMVSLLLDFGADVGKIWVSPSRALESVRRYLELLRQHKTVNNMVYKQSTADCERNLYTRILGLLVEQQRNSEEQSAGVNILKRSADNIEDGTLGTHIHKIRYF